MPVVTIAGIQIEGIEFRTPFVSLTNQVFNDLRQTGKAGLIVDPVWQRRISAWDKTFGQLVAGNDDAAILATSGDLVQNTTTVEAERDARLALASLDAFRDFTPEIRELQQQVAALSDLPVVSHLADDALLEAYQGISLPQGINTSDSPTFNNLTIAGLTITGLTKGSVMFAGTGGLVSQDNANFFWDATNHRLGIGNAAPAKTLDIGAASNFTVDASGNVVSTGSVACPTYSQAGAVTFQNITSGDLSLISAGDILLTPTGNLKFGTFAAAGAETFNGTITIKDSGGTSRKLAVFA